VSGRFDLVFTYHSFGAPAKDFVIDRVYFAPTDAVPEPAAWALRSAALDSSAPFRVAASPR
jgi:hypothetical protein